MFQKQYRGLFRQEFWIQALPLANCNLGLFPQVLYASVLWTVKWGSYKHQPRRSWLPFGTFKVHYNSVNTHWAINRRMFATNGFSPLPYEHLKWHSIVQGLGSPCLLIFFYFLCCPNNYLNYWHWAEHNPFKPIYFEKLTDYGKFLYLSIIGYHSSLEFVYI